MKITHLNGHVLALSAVAVIALAGCATSPGYGGGYGAPASSTAYCADCGIVESIQTVSSGRSAPSTTGAILGGIVGAIAGHEISDQTGGSKGNQNVSAAAGAAAGALAGNTIQKKTTGDSYDITVRLDDGRRVTINQHDLGGIRQNTYVRIHNGKVVLR